MVCRNKPNNRLGISLLLLGVILALANCYSTSKFKYSPNYNVYTSDTYGTAIKISSSENYVMVGFSSGNAKIYTTNGYSYYTCYGHSYAIIDIEEIPGYGWITLDSYGKAIRWSTSCSQQFIWNLTTYSSYPTDMTVTSSGGSYWVAFNFGNQILEFNATTYSSTSPKIYYPPTYSSFKRIQYDTTHSYLYAATNTSYVYQYDCYSGSYTSTYLYTYYPATDLRLIKSSYGTKEFVLLNNYYIIKFKNTSSSTVVSYSESANIITGSYQNNDYVYILAYVNSSSSLYVHQQSGSLTQTIQSPNYYSIRAIDVSSTYLCAIDYYGYLLIYNYDYNDYYPSDFPVWAIVLMSLVFFIICVVGIVCMIVKARKRRQANVINNYNKFNEQPTNVTYIPPNQPINPPSGQQTSNNPFNPQPTWNSNHQPYFTAYGQPPAQQNPYQANQPSNWS